VWLNGRDRTALVALALSGSLSRHGLYRVAEGQLTPVAVAGQELPGGGRFQSLAQTVSSTNVRTNAVGPASTAGEHVFLAQLESGETATYRLDATDKLSLILKTGMRTELGEVTRFNAHFPTINSKGQIALALNFDQGPDTLVLLTPVTP
jgi:hypothetical protein